MDLNLVSIMVKVDHAKYKKSFALQTGTYTNDNSTSEPDLLRSIFTAHIGISLNDENYLWLNFDPEARSGKKVCRRLPSTRSGTFKPLKR